MVVTLNEVLTDAKLNKYAVGLFNTVNLEMAKGVIRAAENLNAPVIIGTAEILLPYASLDELAYFLIPMAKSARVPVVVHFDHGLTQACTEHAINLGFSSVMFDCSMLTFEENIKRVKDMCTIAHKKGVTVEAELGHVGTANTDDSVYTNPDDAKNFVLQTNCDALAVAIGTAHGAYKSKPLLDLDRLKNISNATDAPLVLHGGSGLTDNDFTNCIKNGISKINIFTDVNVAAAKAAQVSSDKELGMTDLMQPICCAVQAETEKKLRLFGCVNKA